MDSLQLTARAVPILKQRHFNSSYTSIVVIGIKLAGLAHERELVVKHTCLL